MDPVLDELGQVAAGLTYAAPRVPWACALSGDLVTGPEPGYWPRQAREPVRFADAVAALAAQDVSVFVEIGPDGTLSALGPAALGEDRGAEFVPLLRPGHPALLTLTAALGRAHVHGAAVDWAAVLPRGQKVPLPTYAFRRRRYWPRPVPAPAGDIAAVGLGAVGHPLLGAAVELAGGEGYMFTGRLSLRTQPWLADHAVAGTVLLPGTAFVEMAVQAGNAAGCGRIGELALEAPLVLPADGAVRIQVVVDGPDESGHRAVRVYTRPGEAGGEGVWTRHASGLLTPGDAAGAVPGRSGAGRSGAGRAELAVWPPPGAEPGRGGRPVRGTGGGRVRVRAVLPRAAGRVAPRARCLRRGGAAG